MKYQAKILFQSFVKPFYKENAGAFVFVFTMMFCIINKVDGAGVYEYHYSLVTGMLKSSIFLLSVFFIWFLYVRRFFVFVTDTIANPHYTFLHVYNLLDKSRRFRLFFMIETGLLMPVLLYTLFIIFVGFSQHLYLPVFAVICYLLLLCFVSAIWHVHLLTDKDRTIKFSLQNLTEKSRLTSSYPAIVIKFIAAQQKMVWVGIKIFTCGILYLIARNNTVTDYETGTAFLFYNFGILANGVLVFRIREFEETYLSFYRGLPVSLLKRFLQYSFIYLISLVPEFITAIMLVPVHLHFTDGITFMLSGFSLLLLMNSITFLEDFKMKEYLKILLAVLCVQCIFLMTLGYVFLYLLFFFLAIIVFLNRYYKFDRKYDS